MEYTKAIEDALSYARHSKAVLLFTAFTLGVLVLLLALGFILLSAFGIPANPSAFIRNPAALGPLLLVALVGIAALAIGGLALTGTVIRNTMHAETLSESWTQFSPRLWTLVGVVAVTMALSLASNMLFEVLTKAVPAAALLTFILSIVVSLVLAFLLAFAEYAAVLDGSGVFESIRRSYKLALEKPVGVFLAMLVSGVMAFALIVAILIVLIVLVLIILLLTRLSLTNLNLPGLILMGVAGIGALVGVFFTHVFQYHFMAHAYADLRPKPALLARPLEKPPARPTAVAKPAPKPASTRKPVARRRAA